MSEKIKFAIIGFGHIGKRHAHVIRENPNAELVAIADINTSYENEVKEKFNAPFFGSIEKLFAASSPIDVAVIATPNGLHAPHAITALENNSQVVIEKPMALTKNDCERIIAKSLQHSKNIFCVMQNRYSPPSQWLKGIVNENRLGKIYLVQVNCYWNRDDRYYHTKQNDPNNWKGKKSLDGGPLFTQFSHFIDTLCWLFGDVKNIQSHFANFNHRHSTEFNDDSGMVTFDFVNGGMGSFNYSTAVWDQNLESSITMIGENGSIKVGGQYMEKVLHCHTQNYTMPELAPSNPPNDYGAYKGSAANHHSVIQNVIDTLHGKSAIATTAEEGMKVVEIIERIYSMR